MKCSPLGFQAVRNFEDPGCLLAGIDQFLLIAKCRQRYTRAPNPVLSLQDPSLRLCDGAPLGALVEPVYKSLAEIEQLRVDLVSIARRERPHINHCQSAFGIKIRADCRPIEAIQILKRIVTER